MINTSIYQDIAVRAGGDIYRRRRTGPQRKINVYQKVYGCFGISEHG